MEMLSSPLRLKSGFVIKHYVLGVLGVVAGLAIGAAYALWQLDTAQDILRDRLTWQKGVAPQALVVDGKVKSRYFIFKEYDLKAKWTDAEGAPHESTVEFDTLFVSADTNRELDARYLPEDKARITLSWAIEVTTWRWASFAFMIGMGILIGVAVASLGYLALKRVREAQACVADVEELIGELVNVEHEAAGGKATGKLVYHYSLPGTAGQHKAVFHPKHGTPLFVDADNTRMLVLRSRRSPKALLVLRNDFHPLELTAVERHNVEAKLQSLSRDPRRSPARAAA